MSEEFDVSLIDSMDKDQLADLVAEKFPNEKISKRTNIEKLRSQVAAMFVDDQTSVTIEDEPIVNAEYLLNPKTGNIFDALPALIKRNDLVPCDKDGNRV